MHRRFIRCVQGCATLGLLASMAACQRDAHLTDRSTPSRTETEQAAADAKDVEQKQAALRERQADRDRTLLKIATEYDVGGYTNVNPLPRWTLLMCDPATGIPPVLTLSRSKSDSPHGGKLYYLWVRDAEAYRAITDHSTQPRGQTLVKESWTIESVEDREIAEKFRASQEGMKVLSRPTIESNERWAGMAMDDKGVVRARERSNLFIMTKLDPDVDSDLGWVYAVVSADRKAVIESGAIASCMACHQQTNRDRLYGPEYSWPTDSGGNPLIPTRAPSAK